jgi:hypothetical protein
VNRWLVEFDVRLAKAQYPVRRAKPSDDRCLLPPEVEWPLSIDSWVWPSAFCPHGLEERRDAYATIPIDMSHYGPALRNLEMLQARYEANRALAPDAVFIAIELLSERAADGPFILYEEADGIQCGMELEPTVPERLPEGSAFLGFDVATAGRLSALSGFCYDEVERPELRPVWAPRLNAYGLLSELEDAVEFRGMSDLRTPEEAPFWVYALWRLPIE